MAFRDHLAGAHTPEDALSCIHGLFDLSKKLNHDMILSDIIEAPGHRAALNVLARDRLCAVLNVEPGELIDILGWAMQNPSEPLVVDSGAVLGHPVQPAPAKHRDLGPTRWPHTPDPVSVEAAHTPA